MKSYLTPEEYDIWSNRHFSHHNNRVCHNLNMTEKQFEVYKDIMNNRALERFMIAKRGVKGELDMKKVLMVIILILVISNINAQDMGRRDSTINNSIDFILKGKIAGQEEFQLKQTPPIKINNLLPKIKSGKRIKAILVSHKWKSSDGHLLTMFSDTSMCSHTYNEPIELHFCQLYYLSNAPETVFDISKVGSSNGYKYLIMQEDNHRALWWELLEVRDDHIMIRTEPGNVFTKYSDTKE